MSHVAIAAALALEDVSGGERLAAFSLASFANREDRAWPGTRVAAARAGLSRSQYLAAREGLRQRGLIAIEDSGGGRGNAPTVALTFAQTGPWIEREINAPLFEAVLGYHPACGPARLLLATLAAVADEAGAVRDLPTDELRTAAGMADSTYRRARTVLLADGAVALETAGGGRARTNQWIVHDPRAGTAGPILAPRTRGAPSQSARPLIAAVRTPASDEAATECSTLGRQTESGPGSSEISGLNLAQDRTVYRRKGPGSSGVSALNPVQDRTVSGRKGPVSSGVSGLNPAQDRTVSRKTPPQTPPETPPPDARAGRESRNPQTSPPSPLEGGSHAGLIEIVENYVSDRGRKRHRARVIDPNELRWHLRRPGDADHIDWQRIRDELRGAVGDSTFAIWLDPLKLRAIDQAGALLVSGPPATRGWARGRFGGLFDRAGDAVGRQARFADDQELQLLDAISSAPPAAGSASLLPAQRSHDHEEAV